MDDTLIHILEPRKEKGISTLRLGTEMWNYLPKVDRVIKIPPSMMAGSWMGSDFTNDDLVRETSYEKDYTVTLRKEGTRFILDMKARPEAATVWEKMEIHVDQKTLLPIEHIYFDGKGQRKRVLTFKEIRKFGDRSIPSLMVLQPVDKPEKRTEIRYSKMRFDLPLKENLFSLKSLKKRK